MPPKKGKKRSYKKKADAFEKKDWFRFKVPKVFPMKEDTYGFTAANKTAQGVTVESRLEDRVANIRWGDLCDNPTNSLESKNSINIKFRIVDINESKECLLDFHGLQITRDKKCSLMKRWVSTIDARADIRTTDGFVFRVFAMALTAPTNFQISRAAYAKTSQIKKLRAKMCEFLQRELDGKSTKEFVSKVLMLADNGDSLQKELMSIFPVATDSCRIRKVKLIKRPRIKNLRRIHDTYQAEEPAAAPAATD